MEFGICIFACLVDKIPPSYCSQRWRNASPGHVPLNVLQKLAPHAGWPGQHSDCWTHNAWNVEKYIYLKTRFWHFLESFYLALIKLSSELFPPQFRATRCYSAYFHFSSLDHLMTWKSAVCSNCYRSQIKLVALKYKSFYFLFVEKMSTAPHFAVNWIIWRNIELFVDLWRKKGQNRLKLRYFLKFQIF